MGSLLPGWDKDPMAPPKGLHDELLEEKLSIEKEMRLRKRTSVDANKAGESSQPPKGPPLLTRKSAPSSFIIRKLQEAFPENEEPKLRFSFELEEEDEEEEEPTVKAADKLYARDKWWRKFSSANLNEMANDEEKDSGKQTYKPQFDLGGGDPYLKKK